ncbi:hypothetical protein DFH09DRAFT_264811 [Mycena vulgaris]|nr:hypothetical protein DFH09DRAFT_264811 [Mycena vulgaris]
MASESESEIVGTLLFMRYFTAFGLASTVYDHFLTLGEEFRVIWANPKVGAASKVAFGINRYLTEGVIAYSAYVFSGADVHLNDAQDVGLFCGFLDRRRWYSGRLAFHCLSPHTCSLGPAHQRCSGHDLPVHCLHNRHNHDRRALRVATKTAIQVLARLHDVHPSLETADPDCSIRRSVLL